MHCNVALSLFLYFTIYKNLAAATRECFTKGKYDSQGLF
ncbi:hypothetical protein GYH30_043286 [Glycine max]|nr:hypothetical protein GYH30_043286 [Glycine max]